MSDRESWMQFIREEYDPRPNLGLASYPAFDSEWDDGAGRIADAILADETLLLRKHADLVEECAKIAESHVGGLGGMCEDAYDEACRDIAKAIRDAHGGDNE